MLLFRIKCEERLCKRILSIKKETMSTRAVEGIDISMDDFQVCMQQVMEDNRVVIKGSRKFANTLKGYQEFLSWEARKLKTEMPVVYVMEATGVYYENLAVYLHEKGKFVCVELANKTRHFAQSHNLKTKTDKVDAKTLAMYGVERRLEQWEPMSPQYKELRDVCREKLSIQKELNRAKNQLHAMSHSNNTSEHVKDFKVKQIEFYDQAILELKKEIRRLVKMDPELERKLNIVQTIPGVGLDLAVVLACETNGFKLIKNIRQLVSYAGLDVEFKQSGLYNGKTRITKKGNARIRQALYMPALAAIQWNKPIKQLNERVCERNPTMKKKGVVAGMRKLLILTYTLWKKEEEFNTEYKWI